MNSTRHALIKVVVFSLVVPMLVLTGCSNGEVPTWVFESEEETNHGCGEIATDCDGVGEDCWHASDALCPSGGNIAYGPYTTDLPLGTYQATWRIKADTTGLQLDAAIMMLDVYAAPNLYMEKVLTAGYFPSNDTFYEFSVTFLLQSPQAIEFRSWYLGPHPYPDVWIDKVTVVEADPYGLVFEAEEETHHGCGEIDADCDGVGEGCWHANDTLCPTGGNIAFGPYFDELPYGHYRFTWRMKADMTGLSPDEEYVILRIAVNPTSYEYRKLYPGDFPSADSFYDITVDNLVQTVGLWEFVAHYSNAAAFPDVWIDKITVEPIPPLTEWTFEAESDHAGHVCGDLAEDCGTDTSCWHGSDASCEANNAFVFGPYTYQLPRGSFRASYRLKSDTSGSAASDELFWIDVAGPQGPITEARLTAGDFPTADQFHEFTLDFESTEPIPFEFRAGYGVGDRPDVWMDKVVVTPLSP